MKITETLFVFPWTSMSANNCNTYLIKEAATILIDPGHVRYFEHVRLELSRLGLEPGDIDLVIGTHAHPDHIEAVGLFKNTPALFAVHESDWRLIEALCKEIPTLFGVNTDDIVPDFFLREGELAIKGIDLRVFHSPGHSPGSVCLYWPQEKLLFTGDSIFKDGLGRTDLPGGDGQLLKTSIRRMRDLDLAGLLPGHGEILLDKRQIQTNFERLESHWFAYI